MIPWYTNLPTPLSSFVGREREIAGVQQALASNRLLTLTGAGGCGKTRLAIATAERLATAYAGRVWLVDLSALSDPALMLQAVAAVLHVREESGVSLLATLVAALAPQHTLLVLDNCEHLVDACGGFAEALLCGCPMLQILATSRETLAIPGERIWVVPPLTCPAAPPTQADSAACLLGYEAVRLFVARARAANLEFSTDLQALAAIGEICRRLDGMPLAIELAAARVRTLAVQQIAARLEDCIPLLMGGSRTAPPRHRTMTATLDWSYALLCEQERTLFRRLAVLRSDWSLEAAEAVCADATIPSHTILDLLSGLVHKSLVVAGQSGGEVRYRMLETVRQYARQQLNAIGEQASMQDRHLVYFATLSQRALPFLTSAHQVAWFQRLEQELDNLRAAMDWSIIAAASGAPDALIRALRLPADLERFWTPRGYSGEGAVRLRRVLDLPGVQAPDLASVRAYALNAAGVLAWFGGNYEQSQHVLKQALVLGEAMQDRMTILVALRNLGTLAVLRRDLTGGVALLERGLALGRELEPESCHSLAWIMAVLGIAAYLQSQDERASALLEASATLFRELGDMNFLALVLRRLGQIALRRNAIERAYTLLRESLALNRTVGSPGGIAACLNGLAAVLLAQERPADAARLLAVAQTLLAETADKLTAADHELRDLVTARVRAALGAIYDDLWAEGLALHGKDASAYADTLLAQAPPQTDAVADSLAHPADRLTPREHEVALLVAQGFSNRKIAQALTVEIKTVEAHLTRIRAKLGASSRVQIATWAFNTYGVAPKLL